MIAPVRSNVMKLVRMIGQEWRTTPYKNQRQTPAENMASKPIDTSPADFETHVFCSCGQKAQVVNVPAANPNRSIPVIARHPSAGPTFSLDPSDLLVKTNGPVIHFDTYNRALNRLDEGVYPWHIHAISVANAANPAITSVMPITRPSVFSNPTSNQSEH